MGKLVTYLSILIFVDLLFIVTGQIGAISSTSIILNTILDLGNLFGSPFYILLFVTAIGGIAVTSGVTTGILNKAGIDLLAFVVTAVALAALGGDFLSIFTYLFALNEILAMFIMAPLIILFLMSVFEWLRGKD